MMNSSEDYGLVAILLHWLVALALIGLFGLGLWMVELSYYDAWYRQAPAVHKGMGILLCLVMLLRLGWRLVNVVPKDEPDLSRLERRSAHLVHWLLYLLPFAVMISGYLISTADGRPIEVFGLFSVPALVSDIPNQEDLAGRVHLILAISLIGLASLHALAALKHHFIDRNRTLLKMLGLPMRHQQP
ncbi:MAG: cytochrome b [Pseudomonadota bacterium]